MSSCGAAAHGRSVEDQHCGGHMKDVQRTHYGGTRFEKLPQESLCAVNRSEEVETIARRIDRPAPQPEIVEQREARHDKGFVKLHGVAREPISEVEAPWQIG